MSLFGAMFAGVSGLNAQSQSMGMISDNIANVNTVGFKGSEAQFSTLVTRAATKTTFSPGGVQSNTLQRIDQQGLIQASTSKTDIGILGDGFFVINEKSAPTTTDEYFYTRAGSFTPDKTGFLTNTAGFFLMGWPTDSAGVPTPSNLSTLSSTQAINVKGIAGNATATTTISIGANLPAAAVVGASENVSVQMFDSLGVGHSLGLKYTKGAINQWNLSADPPKDGAILTLRDASSNIHAATGRLDFNALPAVNDTVSIKGTTYTFIAGATAGNNIQTGVSLATTVADLVAAVADSRITQGTGTENTSIFLRNNPPASTTVTASSTGNVTFTIDTTNINAPTILANATATSNQTITINMRGTTYTVAILNTDTATQIGGKIVTAIDATNQLFDAAGGAPTVTVTVGPSMAFDATLTPNIAQSANGVQTVSAITGTVPSISFNGNGTLASTNVATAAAVWANGANASSITLNHGTAGASDGMTQFSSTFVTYFIQQNGVRFGTFSEVSINDKGIVTALFDNGQTTPIFKIPLATFSNANGLSGATGNVFRESDSSGTALLNQATTGAAGTIAASALEASNVDLADEFTSMIVTQRAYTASARIITTVDEMLEEVTRIAR